MVVSSVVILQTSLAINRASEFSAPDDQCVVQQTALLQIGDQCRLRLINIHALFRNVRRQTAMIVPATMIQLHKTDSLFQQATGQQTICRKAARPACIVTIHAKCCIGFLSQIREFRD